MAETAFEKQTDALNLPWSDVVRFIRQLSHDLRNHLNAIELQSTYIGELEGDELKAEIARLRSMISGFTSALQSLSRAVSEIKPNFISYWAADLAEDLRKKIDHDFSGQGRVISWNIEVGDAMLNVDPQLLQEALSELFNNAFRHAAAKTNVTVTTKSENGQFLFTIEEPKAQFEGIANNWASAPLQKVTANHYGLGLHRVRGIIEGHGGKMHTHYDPNASVLVTTLALPVLSGSSQDA